MKSIEKYYKVLGIEPGASLREIKEAYRDLASVWHPDRFTNNSRLQGKAQEKLKEINLAYEYLRSHHASDKPKLTEIIIDPQAVLLNIGESQLFRLIGLDQNRNSVNINCANWSTTGGTISSEGLFLAEQEGCFIVRASTGELTTSIQISVINSSSQEIDDHIESDSDKRKDNFPSQSDVTDGYQWKKSSKNSRIAFFIRLIVWGLWVLLLLSSNPDPTQSLFSVLHIPFFIFCLSCLVTGIISPLLVIVWGFERSRKTVALVYLSPILIAVFCPVFPFYWIPFTVIETSIWVAVDSRRIGVKKGQLGGRFFDRGRWGWFFLCLLIWVVGFPFYLVKRGEYLRRNKQAKASPSKAG